MYKAKHIFILHSAKLMTYSWKTFLEFYHCFVSQFLCIYWLDRNSLLSMLTHFGKSTYMTNLVIILWDVISRSLTNSRANAVLRHVEVKSNRYNVSPLILMQQIYGISKVMSKMSSMAKFVCQHWQIVCQTQITVYLFFSRSPYIRGFRSWRSVQQFRKMRLPITRRLTKGSDLSMWVTCTQSPHCHYECDRLTAVCE